jgi:modulator of FtsH protease HflK
MSNEPLDPLALKPATAAAPPLQTEVGEDSGTQALSEALKSSFLIVKLLMIAVVVIFLGSGIFTVGPQEKAIKLRFGKPVGTGDKALLGPGLHFAFPAPIDEVVRIPIGQVQTVKSTIGWYATTAAAAAAGAEPPPTKQALDPASEGYLLTADGNIIHVAGTLRYRISEPGLRYMFDFKAAANMVQNALNNAIVYASSRYTIDNILTADMAGYQELVRKRLEQLIIEQDLGVIVDQIEIKPIPPRQLSANFRAVLEAGVQSAKVVNDARQYANQTVSRANAEARTLEENSQSDRARLVEFVAAEAKRFENLLPSYRSSPDLFVLQQKAETLKRVLPHVDYKWNLPPNSGGRPPELRLQMNPEPPKAEAIGANLPKEH